MLRFYVGCDLCNNWFHGECVNINEQESKDLAEFICGECKHARDTQELYCLCRQPYDESQFYICCDKCQDWFHGRCVGILQSEADSIEEYICPNCQHNSSVNLANMKEMGGAEYDSLKKLIKQIQVRKQSLNDAVYVQQIRLITKVVFNRACLCLSSSYKSKAWKYCVETS